MKRAALILLVLGALILVALGAYLLLVPKTSDAPVSPGAGGNPFGFSAGGTTNETLSLTLDDGSTVVVPDFTSIEQPEWASEAAGYQVAGNADADFLITYIAPDTFGSQAQFIISLSSEPLGEVRKKAETALKARLQVSESELCKLDVQVWTSADVSLAYAGGDLGLSFCPGAVTLP